MCTETFLRLPEEKRRRFLAAAWEEFTRVRFADASINQIIRRAGIPRGSFYQYFADKEDLFAYLVKDVQETAVELFRTMFLQMGGDIFRVWLAIFDRVLARAEEDSSLLNRCMQLLQVNPGFDLQRLMLGVLEQDIPPELWERIDTSSLRCRDPAYVRRVFLMVMGTVGHRIVSVLLQPERAEEFRRELEAELEIIQYGCMRGA